MSSFFIKYLLKILIKQLGVSTLLKLTQHKENKNYPTSMSEFESH